MSYLYRHTTPKNCCIKKTIFFVSIWATVHKPIFFFKILSEATYKIDYRLLFTVYRLPFNFSLPLSTFVLDVLCVSEKLELVWLYVCFADISAPQHSSNEFGSAFGLRNVRLLRTLSTVVLDDYAPQHSSNEFGSSLGWRNRSWLSNRAAWRFSTARKNITLHIGIILKEGELDTDSVRKESLQTALEGGKGQRSIT